MGYTSSVQGSLSTGGRGAGREAVIVENIFYYHGEDIIKEGANITCFGHLRTEMKECIFYWRDWTDARCG